MMFTTLPPGAGADSLPPLMAEDITTALTDQKLVYDDGSWQHFYASGRTLYNAGRDSWGYWEVRGDQYCSQWPPADGWACYDVLGGGEFVTFIGESGDAYAGTIEGWQEK